MLPKWIVLNIGSITRNKFWGERDSECYRNIHCTSTLIKTDTENILIDPSMEDMNALLDYRCGLTVKDISKVFITHAHWDHMAGLNCFPDSQWLMMPKELEDFSKSADTCAAKFIPAGAEISPGIKTISLPGHTSANGGLKFESHEGCVVIAGDAVMTRDFFRHRTGYFNSVDFKMVAASIEKIVRTADVVVPGHDNYFIVTAAEKTPLQEIVYTK